MTTTVSIGIQGNKKVEVKVVNADGSDAQNPQTCKVAPNGFTVIGVHGDQILQIKEIGDFVS